MFGYNPYGAYSSPYSYGRASPSYSSPDADYLRALAQERAAQEQLLAARRAQEEARQRGERARLARPGYGIPSQYNPIYDDLDDYENHDSYDGGFMPYGGFSGYSPSARQRRAMMEQERQRALQREVERRERERELERLRLEEVKRQLEEERRRLMEEERRQRIREGELRRREQEYNRQQRASQFDPLFGPYAWDPEEEDTVSPRTGRRPRTVTPTHRRGMASQGTPASQTHLMPGGSAIRASSVPPRSAVPPSPIRPTAANNNAGAGHFKVPIRTPSPKSKAPSPKPQPTPEQHEAARKIQETYRTHAARTAALHAIDEHRAKFNELKTNFHFPATLDFAVGPGTHDHVAVPVDPAALSVLVFADGASVEEGRSRRPRLAYTSQNAVVHGYLEELNRLLSKLDAIESGGDKEVRERRKSIVMEVEAEAERVEAVVGEVWAKWQARQETETETVKVAPGTYRATTEHPTAEQQHEKTMDVVEQPDQHAQPEAHLDQPPPAQPTQTEETVRVAPGVYDATAEPPSTEQEDEKRMDVEQNPGEDAVPEAHIADVPMQTGETVPIASGVYEATADSPTDAQQGEKRMDVERNPDEHAGAEATLDIVPHVEPMQVTEVVKLVPAVCSSADDTETEMDSMQVEPIESAPTPEVDIPDAQDESEPGWEETQEGHMSDPVVESAPSLSVEILDAEQEGGYESDNEGLGGRRDSLSVPAEVESPVEIKDADAEDQEAFESQQPAPTVPASPVHVHPQFSAIIEQPPSPSSPPAEQPKPEVMHIEMRCTTEGEPSTSTADRYDHPATPTLSPSHGDAESEDEGPGTPPPGHAPHIVVTPAEEHHGARGELGVSREEVPESENKLDAEAAHELRMVRERELF
ncbi:uncharacterized protein C8Q71DRAFT_754191 [Rhodofomes roseus]|uniref:BAG domain-containing protein n=1 Tax=Rhodofomes roseus TaxID=34475 RepID=A0ABQ8KJP9_9APHY|nr:uncharacterized protein C8Q71DRAFT_754191 [Rhodofomes roseus]KAH9837728.1 hypothetical protein C8Q71DRAFT_754191 [Rhodofomes roseus]